MKTKIILLAIFSLTLFACKKEKDEPSPRPTPKLEILFGYSASFDFMKWVNQTEISMDSIKAFDDIGISIAEKNLASFNGYTTDSGVTEFTAKTNNDEEVFNSEEMSRRSAYAFTGFGSNEFGGELFLPYKFSNTAIKGNDTLEISNSMDELKIIYKSKYTTLSGRDSIRLIP